MTHLFQEKRENGKTLKLIIYYFSVSTTRKYKYKYHNFNKQFTEKNVCFNLCIQVLTGILEMLLQ